MRLIVGLRFGATGVLLLLLLLGPGALALGALLLLMCALLVALGAVLLLARGALLLLLRGAILLLARALLVAQAAILLLPGGALLLLLDRALAVALCSALLLVACALLLALCAVRRRGRIGPARPRALALRRPFGAGFDRGTAVRLDPRLATLRVARVRAPALVAAVAPVL